MPEPTQPRTLTRAWTSAEPLLSVRGLKKWFPVTSGVLQRTIAHVHAVDGVGFDIKKGETLGLVGESGWGKSTLGRTVIRLLDPTAGTIKFKGEDIANKHGGALRSLRREMTMIFQDPYASLDPRQTVADIVGYPFDIHHLSSARAPGDRIRERLLIVGSYQRFVT